MTVGTVQAYRAGTEFPSQHHAQLQGWTELHAHRACQVGLREERQCRTVYTMLPEILQAEMWQRVISGIPWVERKNVRWSLSDDSESAEKLRWVKKNVVSLVHIIIGYYWNLRHLKLWLCASLVR